MPSEARWATRSRLAEKSRGLDQGCPLSPALCAAALRKALAETQAVMHAVDPESKARAYLGDDLLMGSAEAALAGIQNFITEARN
jgi:hypothetical protein